MSGATQPPQQLVLFEITSEKNSDGSFRVVPIRVHDQHSDDVSVRWAAHKLKLSERVIRSLCRSGWLDYWANPSDNGNARFRIARASILTYKERRKAAMRR